MQAAPMTAIRFPWTPDHRRIIIISDVWQFSTCSEWFFLSTIWRIKFKFYSLCFYLNPLQHPPCQCFDTYHLIGDFDTFFFVLLQRREKALGNFVFFDIFFSAILQYPSAKINKIKLFIWKNHRKFVGTRGDFIHKPQDIIYKQEKNPFSGDISG